MQGTARARDELLGAFTGGRSPIATSVRLALLLLAALLVGFETTKSAALPYVVVILLLALITTRLPEAGRLRLWVLLAETLVASAGVAAAGVPVLPLLVALSASAIGAGLAAGYGGALAATGTAATVLLGARLAHADSPEVSALSSASAQWMLFALATSLLAARISALSTPASSAEQRYVEAHRLLGQLRSVTRGLPGSLDPGSVARDLLEGCIDAAGCEYGSVMLNVGGDQLVPLALHGYQRIPWRADLTGDGPIQRAWLSGARVVDRRAPDADGNRLGSTLLVLPMTVSGNRVGVVALESRKPGPFKGCAALDALVAQYALPLETAALFDELRISAAAEERARLAREMHDGIAQDLAFLGYELDGLTAVLMKHDAAEGVEHARRLRQQMTSLISDLRLSLSDLRSSVGPGRGLGAALSQYARAAGTSSRITVHLTLAEGSTRLPANTEVQLLRIAHEAVNRARRRPSVANLWVSLEVDPPGAVLVIEDDGCESPGASELGADTRDMAERAQRIRADFSIERRLPRGSQVQVSVKG